MVDFKNEQLYRQDSIDKQLKITFDSGTITNSDIPSEQFELTESLSSDSQLLFGSCEASEIKFRIYNVFLPLKDKWLTVTQTLNGDIENPLQIGKYKVYSDKPTADRGYRDVVAYDSMYDIINTDVASWYNGLTFPMSLKAFRDSFFAFFGIEQENVSLVNDSMVIERTIEPSVLSGKDVIQSICEINGCFGHINRNSNFQYITLSSGLYPSEELYPADDLFLGGFTGENIDKSLYLSADYEDYVVQNITGLQIRQEENDIGAIVGTNDNLYIIQDNFLVYGKSAEDLRAIASNALGIMSSLPYRPFNATVVGNPCFEVGDAIVLHTKHQDIETYIMQRTLSGVQNLRDNFSADGEEYQSEKVNGIQTQIAQLKGKTNTLERTVDETLLKIENLEKNVSTEFQQLSESVAIRVNEEGEVVTDLTLDKNGMSFVGDKLVVKSNNFSIDEEGNASYSGGIDAKLFKLKGVDVINLEASGYEYISGYEDENCCLFGREDLINAINGVPHAIIDNVLYRLPYIKTYNPGAGLTKNTIESFQMVGMDADVGYLEIVTNWMTYGVTVWESDTKLKKNIKKTSVESALEKVEKIDFVQFDWKSTGNNVPLGVTANQLEKVIPEAVYEVSQENNDLETVKNIKNPVLTTYALKAIQEMSTIIKTQKQEIDTLKEQVSFLMQKLGDDN